MSRAPAAVRTSAPGKVIVFGEHAAVYGEPALGVPLSRHVAVELAPGRGRIAVDVACGEEVRASREAASPRALVDAALGDLARDHDVRIELGFPPMSGLGSSAALAVALLLARDRVNGVRASRAALLREAIRVENVAHGVSSGIDPAIALYGGPIRFEAQQNERRVQRLKLPAPVALVVGTRGAHGGTRRSVSGVRVLRDHAPQLVQRAMEALGEATRTGIAALRRGDLALAGRTMDLAHGVLSGLGLVAPGTEAIIGAARANGALGAKMSGAGGAGGAFVALAPTPRAAARIARALERLGAVAWPEQVGG